MLMREWNGGSALRRWLIVKLMNKRNVKALMVVGLLLVGLSVVMAITLVAEDPEAAWLPKSEDPNDLVSQLIGVTVAAGAVGFLGGWVQFTLKMRRERRLSAVPAKPPTSAFTLGVKWMFSGWRLWTVGLFVAFGIAASVIAAIIPSLRGHLVDRFSGDMVVMNVFAAACMSWALTLKGRELRRGKEQIKVAVEYLAIREARLQEDFNAMWHKRLEQQQAWEAEKTAQLYEQILDQQARGLLPCPNCSERGDQRKSA